MRSNVVWMQFFVLLILLVFSSTSAISEDKGMFLFEHTKGSTCAENWIFLEKLIVKNKVRCKGLKLLNGFPYLRGSKKLLQLATELDSKYSKHKWLELLRRTDLQARYLELDALPSKELAKFCDKANINCFKGRIRAYIARCSAIMMGDEKRNHDYMEQVIKKAEDALSSKESGNIKCFEDIDSLDGELEQESYVEIFSTPPKALGAKYLNKRIQGLKNIQTNPLEKGRRY